MWWVIDWSNWHIQNFLVIKDLNRQIIYQKSERHFFTILKNDLCIAYSGLKDVFVSISLTTVSSGKICRWDCQKVAVEGCSWLWYFSESCGNSVQDSKIGWLVHPQNMSNHIDTVTSWIQAQIYFFGKRPMFSCFLYANYINSLYTWLIYISTWLINYHKHNIHAMFMFMFMFMPLGN